MHQQRIQSVWLKALFFLLLILMAGSASATEDKKANKLFATVNGYDITEAVFVAAVQAEASKRYYHGRITEARLTELKETVGRTLIDRVLLIHEADKQEIQVDLDKVELEIADFDQRYSNSPEWQKDRARVLPSLRKQLESKALVLLLENKVRTNIVLTEVLKKAFYKKNPDLFVFPERKKVSLILIDVAPSARTDAWDQAETLLHTLLNRMQAGESFSELAKEYSDDKTAPEGGDMGYQHKGMLHDDVELALDALSIGEISAPIQLLQGVILVRLEGVIPAQQIRYEDSLEQINLRLTKKISDQKWDDLLNKLRHNARVVRF